MFINPKAAIEKGWVTNIKDTVRQIQPNAIDFTLDKLFIADESDSFVIYNNGDGSEFKKMKQQTEVGIYQPESYGIDKWLIKGNTQYECMSDMYVNLPEGVAAVLFIRSTLNRNQIQLIAGLYDSGFIGHLGFQLRNNSSMDALIGKGSRVGQIAFVSSENAHLYAGGYNTNIGTHWSTIAQ